MTKRLYTIGYSKHTLNTFTRILRRYRINAVVDVRSTPFSNFKPEFNKDNFKQYLKTKNIKYVFLGNECGARFDDPNCYINGKADYGLIAQHEKFMNGLMRIKDGFRKFTITLMCAEKDPINCHRMILICRNLKRFGLPIYHILNFDKIESHSETENRLLKIFKFNQLELFNSENDQLELAYDKQGDKIAFQTEGNHTLNNGLGDIFNG